MIQISQPFQLKSLSLKNRVVMPPMCQYSVDAHDGKPNDWHFVHYVSRAVGGTGFIIIEMTNVERDGRITDKDLGLWSDDQVLAFRKLILQVQRYGAKVAIQIAHAGRKAEDAPVPVSSTDVPYNDQYNRPRSLSTSDIQDMVIKFKEAARRAVQAGVDAIEIHGAHGYLIHQFHSTSLNQRTDAYGQDRTLFGVEIIKAMKAEMPENMPLIMRISAVEYGTGGYDLDYGIEVCRKYKSAGVDMFHVSSGGDAPVSPERQPNVGPGFQVAYAREVKEALDLPVIAVGMLDDPKEAEKALTADNVDLIAVGRGMLVDPYWTLHAIHELTGETHPPKQYERGFI